VRFAFYGRTSTGRFQDPESSWQWRLDSAMSVAGCHGRIAVEFLDVGHARRAPWYRRKGLLARLTWLHISVRCLFLPPIFARWARPGGLSRSVLDPFRLSAWICSTSGRREPRVVPAVPELGWLRECLCGSAVMCSEHRLRRGFCRRFRVFRRCHPWGNTWV
jgi:hypothetical protein